MKIWWILSKHFRTRAMMVVGPFEGVLQHMIDTSESCQGVGIDEFIVRELDSAKLDPGGCAFLNPDVAEFEIDGAKFRIDLDKVDGVLDLMDRAVERKPGWWRFTQSFGSMIHMTILQEATFDQLRTKLEQLRTSDEAISANLAFEDARERIENVGYTVRFDKLQQLAERDPEAAVARMQELGLLDENLEETDSADWWKEAK